MLPVVLVNGLVGMFGDERIRGCLAPREVLVPDLLGYGRYAGTDRDVTIESQVDHLRGVLGAGPVHIVGHSLGGVIAAAYASRYPSGVASFVNVEGNFTLADAFWTGQLAAMSADEAAAALRRDRDDPAHWLRDAGVEVTDERLRIAVAALHDQPATTLRAISRSVVSCTGTPAWEALLREVFASVPVHLVAGERSRAGWDVPPWALVAARSYTELPGTGHLMMLEAPELFGTTLARLLDDGGWRVRRVARPAGRSRT